ncbi:MAG: hypothetical protein DRI61_16645 [Chloroflexi bacterium]|nr:MAG: hypothetical protein DRI61_16645 [Chloroflexota bacterium]
MSKFESLLLALQDGEWHSISELTGALKISEERLEEILRFLANANMVGYDVEKKLVKIKQNWKTLLITEKERDAAERSDKMAIGTVIIPPEKTIVIQDTRITNLTDRSLELELKIDKKLREIAINTVR